MWVLAFLQLTPDNMQRITQQCHAGKFFIIEGARRTEHFQYTLEEWDLLEKTQPIGEKVPEPTAEELFYTKSEEPPKTKPSVIEGWSIYKDRAERNDPVYWCFKGCHAFLIRIERGIIKTHDTHMQEHACKIDNDIPTLFEDLPQEYQKAFLEKIT